MKKCKIMIITPLLEQRTAKMAYYFHKKGIRVEILASEYREKLFEDMLEGIEIIKLNNNYNKNLIFPSYNTNSFIMNRIMSNSESCFSKLIIISRDIFFGYRVGKIIKKVKNKTHNYNIIHFVDIADNFDLFYDSISGYKRYIYKYYFKNFFNGALKYSDEVLVVCEINKKRILKEYAKQLNKKNIHILRNFPLVKEYGKNMNNHLSNSKLKKTMVYIGRVDFYARDLDFVLYCLADLPDWKLHIYATEKMDVIQHLKKLTYELKLNERVTFHEPVPYYKLHTEINQYYLGIIPHKRNLLTDYTVPNKLYDYILSGLKVLFSNNPSLLEENEIYNFGMSYEAGNKEDFINKIRLLESKELPEINDKELDWNVNMDRVFNSLI